jgi:tetratricopeptide (TPR) repeat protein
VLLLLAGCGPSAEVRPESTVPADPETLLADADAALERGDLPQAAAAYRRAAEGSNDETVAEQATRVAFDNFQLQQAALAAERWLTLNPSRRKPSSRSWSTPPISARPRDSWPCCRSLRAKAFRPT